MARKQNRLGEGGSLVNLVSYSCRAMNGKLMRRFEIGCLFPVLISFFVGTGKYGENGPAWNSAVLFGGIALSRIGLFSFDLCQVSRCKQAVA